jgi:DNA-binding transcriptional ArsR family regulator
MELQSALSAFAALAQETRLETLRLLIAKGPGGAAAGDIAAAIGAPRPTMSFHLKELANAGLVRARRRGRSLVYAPDYGRLRQTLEFLMADCCQGDPRLCGPYLIREPPTAKPMTVASPATGVAGEPAADAGIGAPTVPPHDQF